MPWYLYLALKQLFATRQRLFFTGVSVISVMLGVALMLIVLGVMEGFEYQLGVMTEQVSGDISVRSPGIIANPGQMQAVLAKVPGVVATTPTAEGFVMVMHELNGNQFPEPAAVIGVDLDSVEKVIPLSKYVVVGSLEDLDDDSVIVSAQLASTLSLSIGSKVQLYSPNMFQQMMSAGVTTLPQELRVVGIYQVGHQQFDKATVIVTLRQMQGLYALGDGAHGINLKVAPGLDVDREAAQVNRALAAAQQAGAIPPMANLYGRSWKQQNSDFLWVVQLEKNVMTLILLIVVVVAAFLTMSLLIVLVLKKTREIGLLGALGATRFQVALCFCLQGVAIGTIGTGCGLIAGFTILHYRDGLIRFVTGLTGGGDAIEVVYQFQKIPAHTSAGDLVIIVISGILLSTLAGFVPAIIASRLNPVEALRNE